jgi:tripartite ATP-independent transporter DctM subunit
MIPPSIPLIIYGALTELSIGRLFSAGLLPGIMFAAMFMTYIALWAVLNPQRIPPPGPSISFRERIFASRRLIPVLLLVASVLSSMFLGIATATEAAAVGVVGALALSAITRTLSWSSFWDGLKGATRTTCMIGIIIAAATFLNVMLSFTRAPQELAAWVGSLQLSPYMLMATITLFFLLLGSIVDNIPMIAIGASLILPLVQKAGFDPIWFGIYLVAVCEIGLITPPVGLNLFVLQRMTGRDLFYVARVAMPFFLLLLIGITLLVVFPQIATFLPSRMTL